MSWHTRQVVIYILGLKHKRANGKTSAGNFENRESRVWLAILFNLYIREYVVLEINRFILGNTIITEISMLASLAGTFECHEKF